MSESLTTAEIVRALQEENMQSLAKLLIPRPLRTEDCDAIRAICEVLPEIPGRVKTALFYLEFAQWKLRDALFHIELDVADRQNEWIIEEDSGAPAAIQLYNIDFKRSLAQLGNNFDDDLFEITYRTGPCEFATVTFPDTARQRFDKTDQDMLDDLNRWRRSKMWHLIGPEEGISHSHGEKWHPLQETYIHNRFALLNDGKADFKSIHKDYTAVFDGVLLPGRVKPCGHRTQTAITSYLHREVIDNYQGVLVPKSMTRDLKHDLAKARLQKKWNDRIAEASRATEFRGELICNAE